VIVFKASDAAFGIPVSPRPVQPGTPDSEDLSFSSERFRVNQACGCGHAGAVDLYFDIMAFWIVIADHKTGHTLASVKRYKLQDFAYGGLRGKELTHEKSF
jgi:hypothetical protein